MTERSAKRLVLAAAIAAVTALTGLAVAGLVVTSRGPQSHALPLVRTSIADDAEVDSPTTLEGAGSTDRSGDRPPPAWPSQLGTTTSTALMAALDDASGDAGGSGRSGTSRRASAGTQTDGGGTTPSTVPYRSVTRKSPGLAPPSTWGTPTTKAGDATTTDGGVKASDSDGDGEQDREVVRPGLRESSDNED